MEEKQYKEYSCAETQNRRGSIHRRNNFWARAPRCRKCGYGTEIGGKHDDNPWQEASHQNNSEDHSPKQEPPSGAGRHLAKDFGVDNRVVYAIDDLENDEAEDGKQGGKHVFQV